MPTSHFPDHLHLNSLHITEELQDFSPYLYMMGAYQYSRFFVCTQGSFTLQVGQETYQLRDRDACMIFINQSFHIQDRQSGSEAYLFTWNNDLDVGVRRKYPSPELIKKILFYPCFTLRPDRVESFIQILILIGEVARRERTKYNIEILQHLLSAATCEVFAHYEEDVEYDPTHFSRRKVYYAEFLDLLFKNFHREHAAEFYARELCISIRYLGSVCKEYGGETAVQSINSLLLSTAKMYLTSSNLSIQQIADELHFASHSFFSQFFRRLEGCTPSEFRARYFISPALHP